MTPQGKLLGDQKKTRARRQVAEQNKSMGREAEAFFPLRLGIRGRLDAIDRNRLEK